VVRGSDVFGRGVPYEAYVGRWSRRLAPVFLEWLAVAGGARWLDVGCGTGAVTQTILDRTHPRSVVGVDPAEGFVEHARQHIADDRARFLVGDAMALDFPDGSFDAAVSALVLNFVPDPLRAVREMARVTAPGGSVGAYVWDYAEGMRMMRVFWDAAIELDERAAEADEGRRFPICHPDALHECFVAAGLREVQTRALDVEMRFVDFDDYWNPFLSGQAPAPHYLASLPDRERARLRDLVRSRLPPAGAGGITIVSRAWAATGRAQA
jgi:SAM-dependent methyltransferase